MALPKELRHGLIGAKSKIGRCLLKIERTCRSLCNEVCDVSQNIPMFLPKELRHVPAVGKDLAVLDGNDGVGRRVPSNLMASPSCGCREER